VVAQDLVQLRAEGRIESVMWTRRTDHFSLQVTFPRSPAAAAPAASADAAALPYPDVRVWLLRADGTTIAPLRRQARAANGNITQVARGAPDAIRRVEVSYAFPLAAAEEAVAIAVAVDGIHRIESLKPM
jgi:hypothetical protein